MLYKQHTEQGKMLTLRENVEQTQAEENQYTSPKLRFTPSYGFIEYNQNRPVCTMWIMIPSLFIFIFWAGVVEFMQI